MLAAPEAAAAAASADDPADDLGATSADEMTCSICLQQTELEEIASVKDCEHTYCGMSGNREMSKASAVRSAASPSRQQRLSLLAGSLCDGMRLKLLLSSCCCQADLRESSATRRCSQ